MALGGLCLASLLVLWFGLILERCQQTRLHQPKTSPKQTRQLRNEPQPATDPGLLCFFCQRTARSVPSFHPASGVPSTQSLPEPPAPLQSPRRHWFPPPSRKQTHPPTARSQSGVAATEGPLWQWGERGLRRQMGLALAWLICSETPTLKRRFQEGNVAETELDKPLAQQQLSNDVEETGDGFKKRQAKMNPPAHTPSHAGVFFCLMFTMFTN